MAKFLAQLIVSGAQIVGKAFARAVRQEIEASQQAAQRLGNNTAKTRSERIANHQLGLSLEEAKQILNISELDKEKVEKQYQILFKNNEKANGGSFYIQSKVVRAKERIDHELQNKPQANQEEVKEKT